MALSTEAFTQKIYEQLGTLAQRQERSFFGRFIQGQLSKPELQEYYRHLYHECTHFVRLVSAVHALAEEPDQRECLAMNLVEEYGFGKKGEDHPNLAKHIGVCVGVPEREIVEHGVYPEVSGAFDRLRELAFSSFLEGLAILVTIEADLPIRHTMMRQALIEHYGLDPKDLRYYDEHRSGSDSSIKSDDGYGGDDVHVAREVALLAKYARTDEEQAKILRAIEVAFEARSELVRALSAHCEAAATAAE